IASSFASEALSAVGRRSGLRTNVGRFIFVGSLILQLHSRCGARKCLPYRLISWLCQPFRRDEVVSKCSMADSRRWVWRRPGASMGPVHADFRLTHAFTGSSVSIRALVDTCHLQN